MKNLPTLVLSAMIAAVVAWLVGQGGGATAADAEPHTTRILATQTIRCGYIPAPPGLTIDPNTKAMSGFDYDIMTAIGKKLNMSIEWVEEVNWGTSGQAIQSGRIDMLCNTNWADPRKARQVYYSTPYAYNPVYAVVRYNDMRFDNSLAPANSPEVIMAGYDGDPSMDIVKQDYPLAKPFAVPDMVSLGEFWETLATKKADMAFVSYAYVLDYLEKNPGKLKVLSGLPPVRVYPSALELAQEPRLKNMIDRAVEELLLSGEIDTLLVRYFGTDPHMYYRAWRPVGNS
ncbi:MAG: transporter substrate-binding domain-containing protein [Alphaproteobacteria bacterium]